MSAGPTHRRVVCPLCSTPFIRAGRQRYCTDRCRKLAWKRARAQPAEPEPPPGRTRREVTLYECGDCGQRYHAQQWCHDCNRPCARTGTGGLCPH